MTTPPPRYNQLFAVNYRAGLIGTFAGESQAKALNRVLDDVNARGLRVAHLTLDRWSIWKRIGWLLVLIFTLGFVGRVPNLLIIAEPMFRHGEVPTLMPPPDIQTYNPSPPSPQGVAPAKRSGAAIESPAGRDARAEKRFGELAANVPPRVVREWASAQGIKVSPSGRIPRDVMLAYFADNDET